MTRRLRVESNGAPQKRIPSKTKEPRADDPPVAAGRSMRRRGRTWRKGRLGVNYCAAIVFNV
jgi:hypothetical protein